MHARALDLATRLTCVAAEVHVLDADGIVDQVVAGIVTEAGLFVFLLFGFVGNGHSFAGQFRSAQGAHTLEDVRQCDIGIQGQEF